MIRSVLIIAAVVGSALLMPMALLGIYLGLSGLSMSMLYPEFSGLLLLINFSNLLLGLGGVLGFSALLAAELAPRLVRRAGRLARMTVLFGLAWGSLAALAVGVVVTLADSSGPTQSALSSVAGPSIVALALVGLSSWWRTKRGA